MTATIRLDSALASTLDDLTTMLHKRKSDVIREAISFYAQNVQQKQKSRILKAVEKTKEIDQKEYNAFEGTISDGL